MIETTLYRITEIIFQLHQTTPTTIDRDREIAPIGVSSSTKPNHLNLRHHVDLCHHVKPPSDHADESVQT